MSNSTASLNRKIQSAEDLQSVVRTMKALAAANIGQYEKSVRSLADYYQTVELGLIACFRKSIPDTTTTARNDLNNTNTISAIIFGSDQGLVGRYNDIIVDYAIKSLAGLTATPTVWVVGERVHERMSDAGITPKGHYAVPTSVQGITPLIRDIQNDMFDAGGENTQIYIFHNRPATGALFEPVSQRLLPLDAQWQHSLMNQPWPTKSLPEVICVASVTLRALVREYLFISLFKACAESLAGENASRLTAMQRADKNIDELLNTLHGEYHRQRQDSIDEELFDVISGFEALTEE